MYIYFCICSIGELKISQKHFEEAFKKVKSSISKKVSSALTCIVRRDYDWDQEMWTRENKQDDSLCASAAWFSQTEAHTENDLLSVSTALGVLTSLTQVVFDVLSTLLNK